MLDPYHIQLHFWVPIMSRMLWICMESFNLLHFYFKQMKLSTLPPLYYCSFLNGWMWLNVARVSVLTITPLRSCRIIISIYHTLLSFVPTFHVSTSSSQCGWTGGPIRPSWLYRGKLLPCDRKPSDWTGCQPIRYLYMRPEQAGALLHCQPSTGRDTHEHTE